MPVPAAAQVSDRDVVRAWARYGVEQARLALPDAAVPLSGFAAVATAGPAGFLPDVHD